MIFDVTTLLAVLLNVFDVNILTYMEVQGVPRNMTVARRLKSRALNF